MAMFVYCWKLRKEAAPYTDNELRMSKAGSEKEAAPQVEGRP
jgi:hypothetical protein